MTYRVHTIYLLINNSFDCMRLGLVNGKIYSTVAIKLSLALYNYFCKNVKNRPRFRQEQNFCCSKLNECFLSLYFFWLLDRTVHCIALGLHSVQEVFL